MNRTGPDDVATARHRILALVREIEMLADSRVPEELFFAEYLRRVVLCLGAEAAVVWLPDASGGLAARYCLQQTPVAELDDPQFTAPYRPLLQELLQSGGVRTYAPGERQTAGLPTPHVLILGALVRDGQPHGVLQVLQR